MRVWLCGAAALALIAPGGARAEAPLASDTAMNTAAGAAFVAPHAWSVASAPSRLVVSPPETDSHIALVDVAEAKDAAAAAQAAWALYAPAAHRPVKLVTPRPAREGWDERAIIDYETSPNEHADVQAFAFRAGTRWTVAIFDGSEATFEKRAAAANLILQSLRPVGYQRETFAGRTAHALDPERVEALKTFVRTAMDELGVPGVGLALVDHGQVVFEGGLGVK